MAVALAQSNVTATVAASPTTITPTFPGATTAGNFLILAVFVSGSTQSITTPAGWTLLATNYYLGQLNIFSFPNNPGGITAVPVTVQAVSGGGVAMLFEFSGMPLAPIVDGALIAQNTTTPFASYFFPFPASSYVGALEFYFIGLAVAGGGNVFTPNNSSDWSAMFNGNATGGSYTPNLYGAWGIANYPMTTAGGSITPPFAYVQAIGGRFQSLSKSSQGFSTIGGNRGTITTNFFGIMTGG